MFSIWMDVLSLIHCYEQGMYEGIQVNFGKEGLYYDKNYSENWWEYYCDPIKYGNFTNPLDIVGDPPGSPGWIEKHITRKQAKFYIDKYIKVKPEILNYVNQYQKENFSGYYVISVHYRGTDKFDHEAKPVRYEDVARKINQVIREHSTRYYRIFIATDDQKFLDYMNKRYGSAVFFYNKVKRSSNGKPIHLECHDPYQQGYDALVDCLLLSRGNYLIRTSSNLSRWSTFFNPSIPVYELNDFDLH